MTCRRRLFFFALTIMMLAAGLSGFSEADTEHFLLEMRYQGSCHALTGRTDVAVVFVTVGSNGWEDSEIGEMKTVFRTAERVLEQEAGQYGCSLDIRPKYYFADAQTALFLGDSDDSGDWAEETINSVSALPEYDSGAYRNTPVFFLINMDGRAFAQQKYGDIGTEYIVLYRGDDASTVRHELMHLYGARDYYYQEDLKRAAERYFADSIMLDADDENRVDSFLAYLLGWVSEPDAAAQAFLDSTAHVTEEMYYDAGEENVFTGHTTISKNGMEYTGDLVDGQYHGYGVLRWENGCVYFGEWKYGLQNGSGTMRWSDGSSYTGQWEAGSRNGKGVFTWASGDVYTGDFVQDQRTGKGTYVWPDGSCYSGDFVDGKRTGRGAYFWTGGDCYTGDWLMNERTGRGTLTWTSGAVFTGEWVSGQRTGYGVLIMADGSVYEGMFENGEYLGN